MRQYFHRMGFKQNRKLNRLISSDRYSFSSDFFEFFFVFLTVPSLGVGDRVICYNFHPIIRGAGSISFLSANLCSSSVGTLPVIPLKRCFSPTKCRPNKQKEKIVSVCKFNFHNQASNWSKLNEMS